MGEVRERCWVTVKQALGRIVDDGLRDVFRKAIG
jgi:hypothetical protein